MSLEDYAATTEGVKLTEETDTKKTGVEVVEHCCYHCGAGKDEYDVPVVLFGAWGGVRQGLCRDCVVLIGSYIL